MQNRITKLFSCPDCREPTDGKSCRCGWQKEKRKYASAPPRRCIYCNMPAVSGRMCERHFKAMDKKEDIKRLEGYLEVTTEPHKRIAIENMISLTKCGKLAHEPEPEIKQEGTENA